MSNAVHIGERKLQEVKYEIEIDFNSLSVYKRNPDKWYTDVRIEQVDHRALFKSSKNAFRVVVSKSKVNVNGFRFANRFSNLDGSVFVDGISRVLRLEVEVKPLDRLNLPFTCGSIYAIPEHYQFIAHDGPEIGSVYLLKDESSNNLVVLMDISYFKDVLRYCQLNGKKTKLITTVNVLFNPSWIHETHNTSADEIWEAAIVYGRKEAKVEIDGFSANYSGFTTFIVIEQPSESKLKRRELKTVFASPKFVDLPPTNTIKLSSSSDDDRHRAYPSCGGGNYPEEQGPFSETRKLTTTSSTSSSLPHHSSSKHSSDPGYYKEPTGTADDHDDSYGGGDRDGDDYQQQEMVSEGGTPLEQYDGDGSDDELLMDDGMAEVEEDEEGGCCSSWRCF